MSMKSSVSIHLGAALVYLLLLSKTEASENILIRESVDSNIKDDKSKANETLWSEENKIKIPDKTLNELRPKDLLTEEQTEKNAKYKHRGRTKFHSSIKQTTESSFRRIRSTENSKLVIVTPTAEVKKPSQIIDSMRNYKKTKLTSSTTSSPLTSSTKSVVAELEDDEHDDDNDDDEDDDSESSEKFSSDFFSIPSYNFNNDSEKEASFSNPHKYYSSPSYSFSSYFPIGNYGSDQDHFKSVFDFDSDLTTPKHDFFDKKYEQISSSIMKRLAAIAKTSPPANTTDVKTVERISNSSPHNKSTVIIKNTKEIRVLDNDKAGTENKDLSDIHGTSIYYEMSVLSTETYNITHSNDDDCDGDSISDPTISTSLEQEVASVKSVRGTLLPNTVTSTISSTKPSYVKKKNMKILDSKPEAVSTMTSTMLPYISTSVNITSNPTSSFHLSSSPTEATNKSYTTLKARNRSYSKRLNFTGNQIYPNSVSSKTEVPPYNQHQFSRILIYTTTPKPKRHWMAPVQNMTRKTYNSRPTIPTTIYSEYFDISNKLNVTPHRISNHTYLTKISSDIDPVLHGDVSGVKKIVNSQSISDNSILSLWKRGSTKYSTSKTTSSENQTISGINEMEIPPTLTAWALASLISPPSVSNRVLNATESVQNNYDENELQRVNEDAESQTHISSSTSVPDVSPSESFIIKNTSNVTQRKISRPQNKLNSISLTNISNQKESSPEIKSQELQAESNISIKNSIPINNMTEANIIDQGTAGSFKDETKPIWVRASNFKVTVDSTFNSIPSVDILKSTGFESITKLPSSVTTPKDELIFSQTFSTTEPNKITTEDYKITTIRFNYRSPEVSTESTKSDMTTNSATGTWYSAIPARSKGPIKVDFPVTTFRPKKDHSTITSYNTQKENFSITSFVSNDVSVATTYHPKYAITTVENQEATTTTPPERNVSSSVSDNNTEAQILTEEINFTTNGDNIMLEYQTIDNKGSNLTTTQISAIEEDTTKIVVEVVTEINSERMKITSENTPTLADETQVSTDETNKSSEETQTSTDQTQTEETNTLREITQTSIAETQTSTDETETSREETQKSTFTETTTISDHDIYLHNSEENSSSNEVIIQDVYKINNMSTSSSTILPTNTPIITSTILSSSPKLSTEKSEPVTVITVETTVSSITKLSTEIRPEIQTEVASKIPSKNVDLTDTTTTETWEENIAETTNGNNFNSLEDLSSYAGDVTTESSSRVLKSKDTGSGAAVAIAVSTIGVIALILLVGLLLVVRRRGRRGIYAQRCTPVSLDAYSLDSVSVGHRKGNQRLRASKRSYGNPAFDDEVTSHPMKYAALANFAMDIDSIIAEFNEIPTVTVRPNEVPPGCEDKNRYSNVLPLPETRVSLSRIGNDPTTEYINANFITGPGNIRNYYIACQAPLANTVVDFWRMIWEHNSRVIVMLTEYMENGVEKCYEYLPPSEISDNKRTFGEYQIILKKREQKDKYAVSTVQLINLTTRTWRELTHLWYFWPAKGVPEDYDSVLDFLLEMRSHMKISQTTKEYDEEGLEVIYGDQNRSSYSNLAKLKGDDSSSGNGVHVYSPTRAEEMMKKSNTTNGTLSRMKVASEIEAVRPCTVVCASGAGRSGALVALDVCARALAAGSADVPRVVRELRAQRPHALSNRQHYVFLYKVLSEYGHKLMGVGVDNL